MGYGGCWVEWREGGGAGLWAVVVGGGCWVGSGFSGLWAVAGQWWLLGQCWLGRWCLGFEKRKKLNWGRKRLFRRKERERERNE